MPMLAFRTRAVRRLLLAALSGSIAVVFSTTRAWSHPLHTTLTEVRLDSADGALRLTIRAFADDFTAAVARHAGIPNAPLAGTRVTDKAIAAYVAAMVSVADARGEKAALVLAGTRQTGELLWVTIRVSSIRSLRGVQLGCRLLVEAFDDQVNIVQTTSSAGRRTVLFTNADRGRMKPICGGPSSRPPVLSSSPP